MGAVFSFLSRGRPVLPNAEMLVCAGEADSPDLNKLDI